MASDPTDPPRGLWRSLLEFVVVPLYVPFLIIVLPILLVFVAFAWVWTIYAVRTRNRDLLRKMKQAERTVTWNEIRRRLESKPGTIVLDNQCLGWLNIHVWWIPGEIAVGRIHDWEPDLRAMLITTYDSGSEQRAVRAALQGLCDEFANLTVIDTIPQRFAGVFGSDAQAIPPLIDRP